MKTTSSYSKKEIIYITNNSTFFYPSKYSFYLLDIPISTSSIRFIVDTFGFHNRIWSCFCSCLPLWVKWSRFEIVNSLIRFHKTSWMIIDICVSSCTITDMMNNVTSSRHLTFTKIVIRHSSLESVLWFVMRLS
jgi:hypothetical protein